MRYRASRYLSAFALPRFAPLERVDRIRHHPQSHGVSQSPALLTFLAAAALLGGCDRIHTPDSRLVGGWAPAGAACGGPGMVVYDKEGLWAGDDVSGRWTVDGDRLTTRVTERGGSDQPGRKVSGEKPSVSTILAVSQTELTLRLPDGSTRTLKRCRR